MGTRAKFGPVDCREARFNLTPGPSHSIGSLTLEPGKKGRVPPVADLILQDGTGGTVTIKHLFVIEGGRCEDARASGGGTVTIADRRVLWTTGHVTGRYNQPNADGSPGEDRALNALLALCLGRYRDADPTLRINVADVPSDIYPIVDWEMENPAAAAQRLCDEHGLAIYLDCRGRVSVMPANRAADFPDGIHERREDAVQGLVRPSAIRVMGERIVEENWVNLVPVGEEIDGTIRPIADLSYKPAGGWGAEFLAGFENLAAGTYGGIAYTREEAIELAEKCIYRWYAADYTAQQRDQLLPWLAERSTLVTVNGREEHGKPYIEAEKAVFQNGAWDNHGQERISDGFQLDAANGVVKFNQPVWKAQTTGGKATAATTPNVRIRVSWQQQTNAADGEDFYRSPAWAVPGGVAGETVVRVPNMVLYRIEGVDQNKDALDVAAAKIVSRELARYSGELAQERVYRGIINASPKGLIRSVAWSLRSADATTVIQRAFERPRFGRPNYRERARQRRLVQVLSTAESLALRRKRQARIAWAGGGSGSAGEPGTPRRDPDEVIVINRSGYDIPAGSLAHLGDFDVGYTHARALTRPAVDDDPQAVIVPEAIPNDGLGLAYHGFSERLLNHDLGAPPAGDSLWLGTAADSFTATAGSHFLVVAGTSSDAYVIRESRVRDCVTAVKIEGGTERTGLIVLKRSGDQGLVDNGDGSFTWSVSASGGASHAYYYQMHSVWGGNADWLQCNQYSYVNGHPVKAGTATSIRGFCDFISANIPSGEKLELWVHAVGGCADGSPSYPANPDAGDADLTLEEDACIGNADISVSTNDNELLCVYYKASANLSDNGTPTVVVEVIHEE